MARGPFAVLQHHSHLLACRSCAVAGEDLKRHAGAAGQVGAGIQIIGHGFPAGGIPSRLILPPYSRLAVVCAGGRGAQGCAVAPVDQAHAQSRLYFQRVGPIQSRFVGHKGPLAAAGGIQRPEIGLIAPGKALFVQIGPVGAVVSDSGDEITAHKPHFGVPGIEENDLVPVRAVSAPLGVNDPHILAPVEHDATAGKLHRVILRAGTGAHIDLILVDIGILTGAGQRGAHKACQHEHQHKNGEEPLGEVIGYIVFYGSVHQGKIHPFSSPTEPPRRYLLIIRIAQALPFVHTCREKHAS